MVEDHPGCQRRIYQEKHRGRVVSVLRALQSQGWIQRVSNGRGSIYVGIKAKRSDALRMLDEPNRFRFDV